MVDSRGILVKTRHYPDKYKIELLQFTNRENRTGSLLDAARGSDILIGLSQKNLFTKEIIRSMASEPVVFALANPDPEISPENARKWGVKILATGRSDFPNQINNALVFPGFFKGLLLNRITKITLEMKLKAAYALSSMVKNPTPGRIIPSIFDKRTVPSIVKSLVPG